MAWRNLKNLNQILLHFWNLWVKGLQTVYRLSESVDILKKALRSMVLEFYMYLNQHLE